MDLKKKKIYICKWTLNSQTLLQSNTNDSAKLVK